MKNKSFTLVEIIVVLVIIGILATIALPNFLNIIEKSKARVCDLNLKALQIALDAYAMEHDIMPASLSELPDTYLNKAYSRVLKEEGAFKVWLAYFIVERQRGNLAYAADFLNKLAKGNIQLITCPSDPTPALSGGVSYGLNSELQGKTSEEYRSISGDKLMIGDSDAPVFSGDSALSSRHKEYKFLSRSEYFSQAVRKDKIRVKKLETGEVILSSSESKNLLEKSR